MKIKKTYSDDNWLTVEVEDIVNYDGEFVINGKVLDCVDPDDIWIKGDNVSLIMSHLCEVLK